VFGDRVDGDDEVVVEEVCAGGGDQTRDDSWSGLEGLLEGLRGDQELLRSVVLEASGVDGLGEDLLVRRFAGVFVVTIGLLGLFG